MSKNYLLILLLVVLLTLTCSIKQKDTMLSLNQILTDKLYKQYDIKETKYNILVNAAQYYKALEVIIENIEYTIAVNESKEIVYISTKSDKFKTKEGLFIDSSLKECLQKSKNELLREKGWAYYIELESGWYAGFQEDKNNILAPPPNDSIKVAWFFKKTSYNGVPYEDSIKGVKINDIPIQKVFSSITEREIE